MLQSLIYKADDDGTRTLRVLDQLRLPKETVYVDIASVDEAFDVIQKMQIRGACVRKCIHVSPSCRCIGQCYM